MHVSFFCYLGRGEECIRKRMRTKKDGGQKEGGKDVSLKNRCSHPFWFWPLTSDVPSKTKLLSPVTLENSKWNFNSSGWSTEPSSDFWNFVTDLWLRWDHFGDFGDIGSNTFQTFRVCCQSISLGENIYIMIL